MTAPLRERRKVARRADIGASVVAGSAGAALGAGNLRDRHVKQYPGKLAGALKRAGSTAQKLGVSAERVKRISRVAETGHGGFKTAATAAGAGAVVGGIKRYEDHLDTKARRAARKSAVTKSAFGVEHGYPLGSSE